MSSDHEQRRGDQDTIEKSFEDTTRVVPRSSLDAPRPARHSPDIDPVLSSTTLFRGARISTFHRYRRYPLAGRCVTAGSPPIVDTSASQGVEHFD